MWLARGELRRVPYKNEQMSMLLSWCFGRKTLWSVFEKNCKIHNSARKQQLIRAIGANMRGWVQILGKILGSFDVDISLMGWVWVWHGLVKFLKGL